MNIHLPAILMFTRGTRFWHTAISCMSYLSCPPLQFWAFQSHSNINFQGQSRAARHMETLTRKAKFPVRHTIAWNDCWKNSVLRSYQASKKRGKCLRFSDPACLLLLKWLKWMWSQEVIGSPSATFCWEKAAMEHSLHCQNRQGLKCWSSMNLESTCNWSLQTVQRSFLEDVARCCKDRVK